MIRFSPNCNADVVCITCPKGQGNHNKARYTRYMPVRYSVGGETLIEAKVENFQQEASQSWLRSYSEIQDATDVKGPRDPYLQLPDQLQFPLGNRDTPFGFANCNTCNKDGLLCQEEYDQELQRNKAWYNYLYNQAAHGPTYNRKKILYLKQKMKESTPCGCPVARNVEFFETEDSNSDSDTGDNSV